MKLSGVIIARNEEENIVSCIKTLNFCDEVVVIDDYSKDKTVSMAKMKGAKVFTRSLNADYAAQRNFGLEKAGADWILFVDADERVPKSLAVEIKKIVEEDKIDGAYIRRDDYVWGKKLRFGETAKVRLLRLGRKGIGKWKRKVHETWDIKEKTMVLKNSLIHYPHVNLTDFLESINRYSTLHAKEKFDGGEKASVFKIIFYPILKLISNWIVNLGFLDGMRGIVVAFVMSFHSFLAWSKLWLYQKKN